VKAVLLAGGRGERLRPLTETMPKCLVPINGIPLLSIWLDLCAAHGVSEVLVNVSAHGGQVRDVLARRRRMPPVVLVEEDRPRGNAGTVRAQRAFVDHEDSFFVLYADNLTTVDLGALWRFHQSHDDVLTLGVFRTAYPTMAGIVTVDDAGRVLDFTEKPTHPATDLANAGVYVVRRPLLECIPDGDVVDFALDVFPRCKGRMRAVPIEGYLLDIGHPAALARAQVEWPAVSGGALCGRAVREESR
jgi:mannose-1-phosphate guanylyltransferase